jgi:inorganic pyrophosphatase
MSNSGVKKALADPSRLKPIDPKDDSTVRAVVETPKGSRNKYEFDRTDRTFTLKRVLPAGMAFPYDFGFFPSTLADDGDPLDVLLLMDEPAFCGCVVNCRLIGVIQGEQVDGKRVNRNDRVVAVEDANHAWANIKHIDDLGKKFIKELEEFFVDYHKLQGKKYRIIDVKGPKAALKSVREGLKAAKKS